MSLIKSAGRFFTALCLVVLLAGRAHAEEVLRDTETENFLAEQTRPIFHAAGIAPTSVHFVLIADQTINAFVAGGQNIFIYSGLILRTDNLEELLGVIAHETGHIAGGHLIKMDAVVEAASRQSILYTLLGIAAGVASGQGDIAAASGLVSQQALLSKILAHSRANEDSADEAGVRFLHKSGLCAIGLQTFMAKLMDEELLPPSRQDEYVRTHPLTRDRFESLKGRVAGEKCQPLPQESEDEYQRIKAKLKGYLLPRDVVETPMTNDIPSRYAHAVALYRLDDMPGALKITAGLEAEELNNPYFTELEGQILFDHGKIPEAVAAYAKSYAVLPDAPLIGESYAQALLANQQNAAAIPILTRALADEKDSSSMHHLLAIAYGRQGRLNDAQLELAEEALLDLNYKEARHHANAAKFPNGSPGALRAADILTVAKEQIDKHKDD